MIAAMPRATLPNRLVRNRGWLVVAVALLAAWLWWQQSPAWHDASRRPPAVPAPQEGPRTRLPDPATRTSHRALPPEAYATLALIERGGPFPYRQDGTTFQNRERLLPRRERGWYREYTVRTPGEGDRGARRIVTGGRPPGEFWYSADHYRSFRRIDARGRPLQ